MEARCPACATRKQRLVLLALTCVASSVLLGTTLPPISLDQLIHDADMIVRGEVQAVTPGSPRQGTRSTIVVISVQETWKAPRRKVLRLVLPRGTEGGITQEVPGLPTFRVGEEVILFVVQETRGRFEVLAGKQGKFSIHPDPASGKPVVEDVTGARTELSQFLSRLGPSKKATP